MPGILNAELAIPQFPALDQYGPNTTLLLHGDGTNGAQNNTFLDSSANNFTITRNGNTTQGTFSPFSQPNGYWSNYFAGSQSINAPASTDFQFAGDFTIEAWAYPTTTGDKSVIVQNSGSNYLALNINPGTGFNIYLNSSGPSISPADIIPQVNQWNHVALVRSGSTVKVYLNGVASGTTATNSSTVGYNAAFYIGALGTASSGSFSGYISNIRAVNGTAVYTSNFTPPTSPLTAITNTKLLTCQSNRFLDNSSNAFAITANGTPSVQAFKPFSAPTAYYPAVNSGAGYFDGSGDQLNVSPTAISSVGSSDFSFECWVYATKQTNTYAQGLISYGPAGVTSTTSCISFQLTNAGYLASTYAAGDSILLTDSNLLVINQWNHCVVCRSGSTISLFKNGARVATSSTSATVGSGGDTLTIGGQWYANDAGRQLQGYMSGIRIVKGSSAYDATQSTITVPTTPLTAITNTSLLLSCTNAGIIDSVSQNQLETVGNAQISTTQSKFGGASMYFDGASSVDGVSEYPYISGTGDFTAEFWVYPSSLASYNQILATTSSGGFGVLINSNGTISYTQVGVAVLGTSANSVASGVWSHVAVARSSGVIKIFVNGNQGYSGSDTTNFSAYPIKVGRDANASSPYTGYVDDLRITKGIARYTQNFTPPQNAYPNYGPLTNIPTVDPNFKNTTLLLHGNGTNGAQNNTFLDSSTNNFTITRNGNTTQGTFTPFSQPNGWWSNYFNGSSYLYSAIDASLALGTSDFTIEAWVYFTTNTTTQTTICAGPGTTTYDMIFGYTYNGAPSIVLYLSSTGSSWDLASGVAMSPNNNIANSWNHIALTRSGSTFRTFFNGSQQATFTSSASVYQSANQFCIGSSQRSAGNANYMNGYISNAKVVIGTSLYNSNFTPSTLPLTATTNTKLLTCQSNYFKDNSSNALAIGTSGTPSAQNFYPFFPPLDYSTAAIGGSGYYDGAGDFLNTPTSGQFTAAGDFTVSCWFYLQSFGNSYYVVGGNWSAGTSDEWLIQIQNNGAIRFLTSADGTFSSAGVVTLNQWMYFTATRSGTTVTVQVNGTTVRTYTKSDTLGSATKSINIGQQPGNNWPWNGYIADFRLVSGSAVTTIPTTPATAISGTGLLLSCTNGAIFDNAAKNNLETVGSAQISTTQSKFGGSSMSFTGTSNYLVAKDNPIYSFGTGDFTVECWIYLNTLGRLNGIWTNGPTSTGSFGLYVLPSNAIEAVIYGASGVDSSITLVANTWYHVAASRSGSTLRVFINGVQSAINTSYGSNNTTSKCVVGDVWVGYGAGLDGYIDDLRITNGVSRYNYNFTPPAAPFPNK